MAELLERPLDKNGNRHERLVELALRMRKNWETFRDAYGADERAWKGHGVLVLKEMHAQISGWIKESEKLRTHPPVLQMVEKVMLPTNGGIR